MTPKIAHVDKIPAQYLKGVGPNLAKLLEKCGVYSVQDVLLHLPFRYEDRTKLSAIRNLRPGDLALIEGKITHIEYPKRRMLCEISDDSGKMNLLFFNISYVQKSNLNIGTKLRCFGEIKLNAFGKTIIHPEIQILSENREKNLPLDKTLTPIYSTTEGLSQKQLRKITDAALSMLNSHTLPDYFDNNLLSLFPKSPALSISLHEALKKIHHPCALEEMDLISQKQHPAQLRLAFEELLTHHLSIKIRRQKRQEIKTIPIESRSAENKIQAFLAHLAFDLTSAQKKTIQEIKNDLAKSTPMSRLIQGDVGCGKTVVAAVAALTVIAQNKQVALMVPTEILCEQHASNFTNWFSALSIPVYRLNSQLKLSEKKAILDKIKHEPGSMVIGTHALFQESVDFNDLGLIIIDEQHRFGVQQRMALKQKGLAPHQLMMTATPIPRTLAMTFYADLDVSVIDELPPHRKPVTTVIIPQNRRDDIIARIRLAHLQKRQVYWVCTLIEESELLQCQAAQSTLEILNQNLPELNIGLIHGKLKSTEKEKCMMDFKSGKIDLLVATTVIEVGVDVPNASVMIIENAERLGLAQCHQLRGRVGRGEKESFCILLYQSPLSPTAEERLRTLREHQDGFKIAEKDLHLRGPGEFLGVRQAGIMNFRVADLNLHQHLFEDIQKAANILLEKHPEIVFLLIDRWLKDTLSFQEV